MTTEPENPETKTNVIEELTAYLDGELDQESVQLVENRLSEDPAYRAEMQTLQKTWDLLDALPQTEPGTSFTKTTMELVAGQAVKEIEKKRSRSWVWPVRIAVMLAVPAILFTSSFAVIRRIQTKPDRILIKDLSLIENHYRFSIVENDMEFLTQLNQKGLFSEGSSYEDATDGLLAGMLQPAGSQLTPETSSERQVYIESLDVDQKKKLKRKMEDYLKLTEAEKSVLRSFDRQLNGHENRSQLCSTMNAYYDWLKTIDSGERSRLLDLARDERVRAIQALREKQALEEFGTQAMTSLPTPEDAETVFEWYELNFGAKEKQIRDRFPVAVAQYAKANNGPFPPLLSVLRKARSGNLHSLIDFLLRADRDFIEALVMQEREMNLLYQLLTPTARMILDDRNENQRRELVLTWIESANQSKFDVSIERLRIFEKTLSVEERDELDKLSREGFVEALKRKYRERQQLETRRNETGDDWEFFFETNLLPDN